MNSDTGAEEGGGTKKSVKGRKEHKVIDIERKGMEYTAREINDLSRLYFLRGIAAILCVSDPVRGSFARLK